MAILSFADEGTRDLFDGRESPAARDACPPEKRRGAIRKLDMLNAAVTLEGLRAVPGANAPPTPGRARYRLTFEWTAEGPAEVSIYAPDE